MTGLFTDKWFSNNLSCSNIRKRKVIIILYLNVRKRKVIIILYLKIVQNNDTMKLVLFSTAESNILTDKNVIQIAKRIK